MDPEKSGLILISGQAMIEVTKTCYLKCMNSNTASVSSAEKSCYSNCLVRYFETGEIVIKKFTKLEKVLDEKAEWMWAEEESKEKAR